MDTTQFINKYIKSKLSAKRFFLKHYPEIVNNSDVAEDFHTGSGYTGVLEILIKTKDSDLFLIYADKLINWKNCSEYKIKCLEFIINSGLSLECVKLYLPVFDNEKLRDYWKPGYQFNNLTQKVYETENKELIQILLDNNIPLLFTDEYGKPLTNHCFRSGIPLAYAA